MESLEQHIRMLKQSLHVIDKVAVYNTVSRSFVHREDAMEASAAFLESLGEEQIRSVESMYVDTATRHYFVQNYNGHLVLISLKQENYNKVLFEVNVKKFCEELID